MQWALRDGRLPTVVSLVHPENQPAARVAIRIGMTRDGTSDLRGITVDVYRATRSSQLPG